MRAAISAVVRVAHLEVVAAAGAQALVVGYDDVLVPIVAAGLGGDHHLVGGERIGREVRRGEWSRDAKRTGEGMVS